MVDYERLQRAYAYGKPDAHLQLEEALREAAGHCSSNRQLGQIARHLAAAVQAGKAARIASLDKEVD